MAATAQQSIYLDEFIRGFELRQSILRQSVSTEVMISGKDATFLIARANRTATTRGPNGLIPSGIDDLNQVVVTMREAHDLTEKTNFNLFTGQANQRRIMQEGGMIVINKEIDDTILTAAAAATVTTSATGSGVTFNKTVVNKALAKLYGAEVPADGEVYGVLTPSSWMSVSDLPQFASQDYVSGRPVQEGPGRPGQWFKWMGVNWTMHPRLAGVNTNNAQNFIWHKSAIGHAVDKAGIQAKIGYDEKQDTSWARHSIYHGARVLQNSGIVKIPTDDSLLLA